MDLLKSLSKIQVPKLNSVALNEIPEDSDDVWRFMEYSIQNVNKFCFNLNSDFRIDVNKYLSSLNVVATKTKRMLNVLNTNFTQKEFCALISFSKNIEQLWLRDNLIPLDEECDFGDDMDGCKIKCLDFSKTGDKKHSNWMSNPKSFENLIIGIVKWAPLKASLKTIRIYDCGISIEDAQEILEKYDLNRIELKN